jgi:hypothetical protein
MKVTNTMAKGFMDLQKKEIAVNEKACTKMALQLLTFCNVGSPNEPTVPPIKSGYLRGSGSVFVNSKFISATPSAAGGSPLKSFTVVPNPYLTRISIIYNTPYAARWHESSGWVPGGKRPSRASTKNPSITRNVGNKWITKHLVADGKDLLWLYGTLVKKELFKG